MLLILLFFFLFNLKQKRENIQNKYLLLNTYNKERERDGNIGY